MDANRFDSPGVIDRRPDLEPTDSSVPTRDATDGSDDRLEASVRLDADAAVEVGAIDALVDTPSAPDRSDVSDADLEDVSVGPDASDVSSPDRSDTTEESDVDVADNSVVSDSNDVSSADRSDTPDVIDAGVGDVSAQPDVTAGDVASDDAKADALLEGGKSDADVKLDVARTCDASSDAHPLDTADQQNAPPYPTNWTYFGLYLTQRDGQTFTVGSSGTLSGIDTKIYRNYQPNPGDGVTLELFRCSAVDGCDTTQTIASVTVPAAPLPDVNGVVTAPARSASYFDLSCFGIPVQANEIYLFLITESLTAPSGNEFGVIGSSGDLYSRGQYWFGNYPWNPPTPMRDDHDLDFVTYVSP